MKKNKTRRWRVVLIILTVLIALLAVLAIWQKNNLQALLSFVSHSQEELEEKIQQNDQTIKDAVNAAPEVSIRDITEEEKQALRDGTLTSDELLDRLIGGEGQESVVAPEKTPPVEKDSAEVSGQPVAGPSQPSQDIPPATESETKPDQTEEPSASSKEDEYQKQINALIARVYVLREEYLLALEQLEGSAKATYSSMAPEDRTVSKLAPVAQDYLNRGIALEAECDAKMDAIVAEMEALLKKYEKSMDLVKTVKYTYANEKSLKKAWYMAKLEKRGLI